MPCLYIFKHFVAVLGRGLVVGWRVGEGDSHFSLYTILSYLQVFFLKNV